MRGEMQAHTSCSSVIPSRISNWCLVEAIITSISNTIQLKLLAFPNILTRCIRHGLGVYTSTVIPAALHISAPTLSMSLQLYTLPW